METEFQATKPDRLDRSLREHDFTGAAWLSRQTWDWLFEQGFVTVNGRKQRKAGTNLVAGDRVRVSFPGPLGLGASEPAAVPVWLAPDRSWGAFPKPAGVDTVALLPWDQSAFASRIAAFAGPGFAALASPPGMEGGLVQRLDRDTSGLVCAAFTSAAKARLRDAFSGGEIEKTYDALVTSAPRAGDLRVWIAKESGERVRAWLAPPKEKAEEVRLSIEVYKKSRGGAWLRVRTRQGMRHVVRAGCAALGAPLVGDALYGGTPGEPHHQLHAYALAFAGEPGLVTLDPPETFLASAARLGIH